MKLSSYSTADQSEQDHHRTHAQDGLHNEHRRPLFVSLKGFYRILILLHQLKLGRKNSAILFLNQISSPMKTRDYHILRRHTSLAWFHEHIFQRTVVLFLFSATPKTPQATESSSIHSQISQQFFSPKKSTLKEKKKFFYLKNVSCKHSIPFLFRNI
jgi:hypothetical protein